MPAPAPDPVDIAGRTVLVVDDNATNRRILDRAARALGDGRRDRRARPKEALGWIETGARFDVAIVDFHMPEMDGLTLADGSRRSHPEAPLPIVIVSSVGGRDRREPFVTAVLTKPVKPSALHDARGDGPGRRRPAPRPPAAAKASPDARLAEDRPHRILLAEDNAVNQKLALRLLERMGYTADVAGERPARSIDALERDPYDVVLMDVQMPEMDGLEATRRASRSAWTDSGRCGSSR